MAKSLYGNSENENANQITEIIENKGFKRIAQAINSSTVYAGKIKQGDKEVELEWKRIYGLAQRLTNQARSKSEFISELMSFISEYEHENMRLRERLLKEGKPLTRVQLTKDDLDSIVRLIEKHKNLGLVANLLVAYGYSRWPKSSSNGSSSTSTVTTKDSTVEDLEN